MGWLRGHLGRRVAVGDLQPDGRVEVEIGGHSAEAVAWDIAGYGARLEVVDPPEMREILARLGSDLVARYGAL